MSLTEVLTDVQTLSRADKLRLIELLAHELATNEADLIPRDQIYPVWSPESAYSAAAAMMDALDAEKTRS